MKLSTPRLRALLDHFAKIKDARQAWKVMYPLREVLFVVVCARSQAGRLRRHRRLGQAHLAVRGVAEFHRGNSCADWLRSIMNRIDPTYSWADSYLPEQPARAV